MRIIEPLLEALTDDGKASAGAAVIPFWGSGVDGRALAQLGYEVYGSDLCSDLIEAHRKAIYYPDALIEELRPYVGAGSEEYMAVRQHGDGLSDAARFLFLCGSSFNGLWRENKKGEYNVPYGRPFVLDEEAIRIAGRQMETQPHLMVKGWEEGLGVADQLVGGSALVNGVFVPLSVLVYADPPYWGTFSGYGGSGFDAAQHTKLAHKLAALAAQGARVVASNADCPEVRALYVAAAQEAGVAVEFREVSARRSIACRGDRRGATSELILVLRR
jgi:DNA adenine methylase